MVVRTMILGIDPSSRKLACFVLGPERAWTKNLVVPNKLKDRPEVLGQLAEQVDELFSEVDFEAVFVEQPLVGRGGAHATIVQAQVQGLVLARAHRAATPGVYTVNVKSWKKQVVGNGNADKAAVAAWLETHQPVLAGLAAGDQDLVDAACIALYGRAVLERAERIRAPLR
jgi:Holliday junction resolvasome RuvABC endonuclease subunit